MDAPCCCRKPHVSFWQHHLIAMEAAALAVFGTRGTQTTFAFGENAASPVPIPSREAHMKEHMESLG
jgi:hypothetical protein